jgi:deoxyxylulose-5-phosphate synthase
MTNAVRKRFCLVVLAALLALAAVCAEVFVFTNLEHEHTGAHCSTCIQIQIAQQILQGLRRVGFAAFCAVFAAYAGRQAKSLEPDCALAQTPVALKVRYNS